MNTHDTVNAEGTNCSIQLLFTPEGVHEIYLDFGREVKFEHLNFCILTSYGHKQLQITYYNLCKIK